MQVYGRAEGSSGPSQNLARASTATASQPEQGSSPSRAIDGDEGSAWNAGDFPQQWIELDLQEPCEIELVRLRVSQSPVGETMHVLTYSDEDHQLITTQVIRGVTQAQQWLEDRPEFPSPESLTGGAEPPRSESSDLSRGLTWVRSNPMFITGLSVSVPEPSPAQVREYFDDFNASAVHLWSNGLPNQIEIT